MFFAALTPLLPRYAADLDLGKGGAGVLQAAYPLGAFVGAVPSGVVAARFGAKRTVLVGLVFVAATTVAFGFAEEAWQLIAARFCQGLPGAVLWARGGAGVGGGAAAPRG